VRRLVIGYGFRLAAAGLLIGVPTAIGGARFLTSLLYGVTPTDPVVLVGASAVLMAIALLACYLPARQAMRVDPLTALRTL
jgi:ABC-type antimicrobial peptide transport system permease subunit